jgi:hypothetical protein
MKRLVPFLGVLLSPALASAALPAGWVVPAAEEAPKAVVPLHRVGEPLLVPLDDLPRGEVIDEGVIGAADGPAAWRHHLYDGYGRPVFDLRRPPDGDALRFVPPGHAGAVSLAWFASGFTSFEPFYEDASQRHRGFGSEQGWSWNVRLDQPVSWHSITFEVGDLVHRSLRGRFDRRTGEVIAQKRVEGRPMALADGLLFAYRTDATVHLIVPGRVARAGDNVESEAGGPYLHVTLPVYDSVASTVELGIDPWSLLDWQHAGGSVPQPELMARILVSVISLRHGRSFMSLAFTRD